MGFRDALEVLLNRPFDFQGRASRSEFWWIVLQLYLAMVLIMFLSVWLYEAIGQAGTLLVVVAGFAIMFAQFAVSARRLHDKGITGWANLLVFVPLGGAVLLLLYLLPGEEGDNSYGPPHGKMPRGGADDTVYVKSNIPTVRERDDAD